MCGIFAYLSSTSSTVDNDDLLEYVGKIQHRGPDMTRYEYLFEKTGLMGFHRLSINDQTEKGMQPFKVKSSVSICNGEIYNHEDLKKRYECSVQSNSDCEIIIPLINKIGIMKACKELDGVFAFVVVQENGDVIVARDPFGVRSLYTGINHSGDLCVASEMKSIPPDFHVKPFPPGTYSVYRKMNDKYSESVCERYFGYHYVNTVADKRETTVQNIRYLLESAVEKRLMSDRSIGCLLSGGLDSSIIASVLCRMYQTSERRLKTFSVGLKGSVDLQYAQKVAKYLGTDHTEVVLTEDEMVDAIKSTIYQIESYDTTTVRASTPMLLLCKYIKQNSDVTVIFSGEGSDEASGSYLYFHNAPDEDSFKLETERLLSELHRFDCLRCDKSTAGAGLEVRVPFLDKTFLKYYMSINPTWKQPNGQIEKRLLREAFMDILPKEVAWRVKEGMSDGVSSMNRPWFEIIQERVKSRFSKKEYDEFQEDANPPMTNEALYYRKIFEEYFPGRSTTIPHYWLPKWSGDTVEPSARTLHVYSTL